jgi:hypothetical protein
MTLPYLDTSLRKSYEDDTLLEGTTLSINANDLRSDF